MIFSSLHKHFEDILAHNHAYVIIKLADGCLKFGTKQEKFIKVNLILNKIRSCTIKVCKQTYIGGGGSSPLPQTKCIVGPYRQICGTNPRCICEKPILSYLVCWILKKRNKDTRWELKGRALHWPNELTCSSHTSHIVHLSVIKKIRLDGNSHYYLGIIVGSSA